MILFVFTIYQLKSLFFSDFALDALSITHLGKFVFVEWLNECDIIV